MHRMLLYAPNPLVLGSSSSHWDPIAFPNLLMEPSINHDLTHGVDLTRSSCSPTSAGSPSHRKSLDAAVRTTRGDQP